MPICNFVAGPDQSFLRDLGGTNSALPISLERDRMPPATLKVLLCPYCSTENDPRMPQCIACEHPLDASAVEHRALNRRPFHWLSLGATAGVALVLVLAAWFSGLTTSLVVIEANASKVEIAQTLRPWVDSGDVTASEASSVAFDVVGNREVWQALDNDSNAMFDPQTIEEQLHPRDESLVLGVGGWRGLGIPLAAFALAGIAVASITRVRRLTEIALGCIAAGAVQLGLWFMSAGFSATAVMEGRFVLTGDGLMFEGSPVMLLGMVLIAAMGAGLLTTTATVLTLPSLTGTGACHHCAHRFSLRPKPPVNCPSCDVRLQEEKLRYVPEDVPAAELEVAAAQADWMDTRNPAPRPVEGPLLCTECARMYEGGQCPTHPDEPLLDPSREEVRFELAEADHRARRKLSVQLMFGGAALAMVFSFAIGWLLGGDPSIVMYVFAGTLTGAIAVANVLAPKLSPPRFSQWSGEGAVNLDEFGQGAQATIYAPLQRAFERMKRRAAWILGGTIASGLLAGTLALIFGLSIGAIAMLGALAGLLVSLVVSSWVDEATKVVQSARDVKKAFKDPYSTS